MVSPTARLRPEHPPPLETEPVLPLADLGRDHLGHQRLNERQACLVSDDGRPPGLDRDKVVEVDGRRELRHHRRGHRVEHRTGVVQDRLALVQPGEEVPPAELVYRPESLHATSSHSALSTSATADSQPSVI